MTHMNISKKNSNEFSHNDGNLKIQSTYTSTNSPKQSAFAGAMSGFISRACVQPLDVLKIRHQLQVESRHLGKYSGIFQTLNCIYKEEGFRALFKGHLCGQIHAISFSMIQFYVYAHLMEDFKKKLEKNTSFSEHMMSNFIFGSLSGIIAISTTQPLDILRTRFVAQGEPKLYTSLYSAANNIIKNEGFFTLYRGLIPSILLITPQSGLQFMFYNISNMVFGALFSLWKLNDSSDDAIKIGVIQSCVSGGVAGALSKVIVFPLDIVKKRMQVQGFEEAREKFGKLHKSQGFFRCFGVIKRQEGWFAFTKGLRPTLLKSFVSIGLKFSVYEQAYQLLTGLSRSVFSFE